MITLFCDLDNTIVYSHRRTLNTAKSVAEMLNGATQSYMTEKTFEFLSGCRNISFIPVTTRTFSQYKRLQSTMESLNCEYALILNGAVLLKNGAIDKEWLAESKELVKGSNDEIEKAAELIKSTEKMILRYCDEFLVYAGSSNPEESAKHLERIIDISKVHVLFDSRKVYCIPTLLDKGYAVKRLVKRLMPELTIAVGDSENDVPMLESVEIPIVPQQLEMKVTNDKKIVVPETEILSDAACCEIEKILLRTIRQGNLCNIESIYG